MSIYVGNLPHEVEDKHLTEVFADYGKVNRVYLPTDRETGKRRGFAFVEMETAEMEEAAIATLDGAEWMGRELKVNKARERENRNSGGGGNYRRNNRY
ncbi:RNP-1 like RNA-binding protein [Gloeothece citriformis PCC 7424]|uniref:RNP-1 like RNA-binding protein n=1 Tax=Gloeothece citriformis (strain PCC 7424) TaxID=65393 RepID=B7K8Q8_GLOC7|nr:RNA-binding protein [Gloeothece citriformis]ACK71256.1 RNP-1 like RNA-binding protein [Gloeothece citriformis PCC 7424]